MTTNNAMDIRLSAKVFAVLALTGLVTAAAPTADADPAPNGYSVTALSDSVVAMVDGGVFAWSGNGRTIEVQDASGVPLDSVPLAFSIGGEQRRVDARISDDGHKLTLTPGLGDLNAGDFVASPLENQLALDDFASKMSTGPMIGMAIGAVLGAMIGGVVGLGSCLIVGPACVATVPAAIGAFAGAGGLAGTLTGGGIALADSLWRYAVTVQSAPGQSPYAHGDGLLDPDGTGVPDAHLRLPSGSSRGLSSGSSSASGRR
ncbi:hypothetical protein ACFXPS_43965 [Nocardia sp. NPDC059091]|uniref:hypothetical protein n=1 Tax=unclassified Nocardia TaxID=2637762 RepID=UPI0036D00463